LGLVVGRGEVEFGKRWTREREEGQGGGAFIDGTAGYGEQTAFTADGLVTEGELGWPEEAVVGRKTSGEERGFACTEPSAIEESQSTE
jgi:hypothetical protein